jgi:streptogramin lyase
VDLWHIHNAILNEERGVWGADIPPGIEANQGVIRSIDDNDNVLIFQDQVRAFRQWMVDHGYDGYPLLITEYGILMPDDYGFDVARVNQYMTDTFAYLSTATDATLGAPWDGGRLVQRWAWFSLDEQPWDPFTGVGFNGNLFDPNTTQITAYGEHFAGLTAGFEPLLHVDLGLGRWQVAPLPQVPPPTQTVDQSVQVRLVNAGTASAGPFRVRLSYTGPGSGALTEQVDGLGPHAARWVSFILPDLLPGRYALTLEIDVDGQVQESAECNNQAARRLVVPHARLYLPLVFNGKMSSDEGGNLPARGPVPAVRAAVSGVAEPAQPVGGYAAFPVWAEYPLPQAGSHPGQLALDEVNQLLWVTERDGGRIARFDLDTQGWQEYNLDAGSQPWGLALDAAGNVWFAESGTDRIGKLEIASGTITEYEGLAAGSQPWGVAMGDDGLVWFTERAGGQLGRLDPVDGKVVEVELPWSGARPGGIAVYGDNVWFAGTGGDLLGRFQISKGEISEKHTTPWEEPLLAPEDVTVIPPGNPWLSNTGGNGITLFRFSTLQNFNTIEAPTPGSEPYGITTGGPDSIWFTERASNRVGRYGPQDYVVEYLLPTPDSQPTDIVVDGEGCAWVAAPGASRIVRLCFQAGDYSAYLPLVLR